MDSKRTEGSKKSDTPHHSGTTQGDIQHIQSKSCESERQHQLESNLETQVLPVAGPAGKWGEE